MTPCLTDGFSFFHGDKLKVAGTEWRARTSNIKKQETVYLGVSEHRTVRLQKSNRFLFPGRG